MVSGSSFDRMGWMGRTCACIAFCALLELVLFATATAAIDDESILFAPHQPTPTHGLVEVTSTTAIALATAAVEADAARDHVKALRLYVSAMGHYRKWLALETNQTKKELIAERIHLYHARAKQLEPPTKSPTHGWTCQDELKNGFETDVDCGGWQCHACRRGQNCTQDTDCRKKNCVGRGAGFSRTCGRHDRPKVPTPAPSVAAPTTPPPTDAPAETSAATAQPSASTPQTDKPVFDVCGNAQTPIASNETRPCWEHAPTIRVRGGKKYAIGDPYTTRRKKGRGSICAPHGLAENRGDVSSPHAFRNFSVAEARALLSKRTVIFAGDSTTRRLFWALCNFLNGNSSAPFKTYFSSGQRGHQWCNWPAVTQRHDIFLGFYGNSLTLTQLRTLFSTDSLEAIRQSRRRARAGVLRGENILGRAAIRALKPRRERAAAVHVVAQPFTWHQGWALSDEKRSPAQREKLREARERDKGARLYGATDDEQNCVAQTQARINWVLCRRPRTGTQVSGVVSYF